MFNRVYFLIFMAVHATGADISVKDYVFWKKSDISAWHQYFPSRLLKQEQQTVDTAIKTIATVLDGIESSLRATVRYQEQELRTAQFTMEGTSAQGCVNGLSSYMENAITEAVETFDDCVADATSYLKRINSSLSKTNATYHSAYQTALSSIDNCAKTYPNKDSWSRLTYCVDFCTVNYFATANSTTSNIDTNRAMGVFTNSVATCGQTAVGTVVAKGWQFLAKLVQCSRLSENLNAELYEKELTSQFGNYVTSNDLTTQICEARSINSLLVSGIEQQMIYYYELQKRALEKYLIESRDEAYYYSQMARYLVNHLNTVSSTSVDNPANVACVSAANSSLNNILSTGAREALQCDTTIVNNTKFLIARANEYFSKINDILPYTGNPAVLSCFANGYMFAEQTIFDCYSLAFNGYKINITELNATIVNDVKVLLGYESSFFSNSSLPCGDSILGRAFLEADRTLYNLQRCLYIGTGTKYAVTTPTPLATVTPSSRGATWQE